MSDPLLTVVIPTRNRKMLAQRALQSALDPLPFSCEILLSDNASSDSTPELKNETPDLRYIRRAHIVPMAEHWNMCVNEARGRYVKLLCDDDWLEPGALEREVKALEENPRLSACGSARWEVWGDSNRDRHLCRWSDKDCLLEAPRIFWKMLLRENLIGPPSGVTFRKSMFGGFPEKYQYATDWAAWILLAEKGPVRLLPTAGVNFQLHAGNLTNAFVKSGVDFIEVQALRKECLSHLGIFSRLAGTSVFYWIWLYRFARRCARYALDTDPKGFAAFLSLLSSSSQKR